MRRPGLVLALAALPLLAAPALAGPPDAVAVFDLAARDLPWLDAAARDRYTEYLVTVVTESGLPTVPRSELAARLKQSQAESYRPCVDESCQIEVGKAVAAQKAVSASFARLGDACALSVKVYDLRTELAEFSTTAEAACTEAGLKEAIGRAGLALRARGDQGYGAFSLALDEGRRIVNPPTDETGYLRVSAEARGRPGERIEVFVNGELAGPLSNGLFTKELPVGRYVVVLRAPADRSPPRRFEVDLRTAGARIPREGKVELEPLFGALRVEGSPATATVVIDDQPEDIRGPLRKELRGGRHRVAIEAPGYLPRPLEEVVVPAGGEVVVAYHLERNAGSLRVVASPIGAEVLLDGQPVGRAPVSVPAVEVGDHLLEVRAPGHHPERRMVPVRRGEPAALELSLRPKRARLKVEALARVVGEPTPVEAEVVLDGRVVGTTPFKGEILAEVDHSLGLRLGDQELPPRVVNLPEGREQRETIEVPGSWGGADSELRFRLGAGPWEVRSGPARLDPAGTNPVRPGRVSLSFLLDGEAVGEHTVTVSPQSALVVVATERPRTAGELARATSSWRIRKWLTLLGAAAAGGVAGQQLSSAVGAMDRRDQAFAALATEADGARLDALRAEVLDEEGARRRHQALGQGLAVGAAVLGAWSLIEWLWTEPERGALELETRTP